MCLKDILAFYDEREGSDLWEDRQAQSWGNGGCGFVLKHISSEINCHHPKFYLQPARVIL